MLGLERIMTASYFLSEEDATIYLYEILTSLPGIVFLSKLSDKNTTTYLTEINNILDHKPWTLSLDVYYKTE